MPDCTYLRCPSGKILDGQEIRILRDLYHQGFFEKHSPKALNPSLLRSPERILLVERALRGLDAIRNDSFTSLRFVPLEERDYALATLFASTVNAMKISLLHHRRRASYAPCDIKIALQYNLPVRILSLTEHTIIVSMVFDKKKLAWAIRKLSRTVAFNLKLVSYVALFDFEIEEEPPIAMPNHMQVLRRYRASDLACLLARYGKPEKKQLWDY